MYGSVFVQKGRHCSRFRILGGVFVQKLKGDTACDFRFGELVFVQNLEGDAACDLRFGKCMEVYLSKTLRGTLLAI